MMHEQLEKKPYSISSTQGSNAYHEKRSGPQCKDMNIKTTATKRQVQVLLVTVKIVSISTKLNRVDANKCISHIS